MRKPSPLRTAWDKHTRNVCRALYRTLISYIRVHDFVHHNVSSTPHRALYRTLTSYIRVHDFGRITVVLTGDILAMWIRDSAVQVWTPCGTGVHPGKCGTGASTIRYRYCAHSMGVQMEVAHSAKEVCEQQQLHMFTHAAPARSTLFTQVASYLPRIAKRPALRCGEGGVIRSGVEGGRE